MTPDKTDPRGEHAGADLVVPPDVAGLGQTQAEPAEVADDAAADDAAADDAAADDAAADDAAIGVAARRSLLALIVIAGLVAGGLWLKGRSAGGPPPTDVDILPPRATDQTVELPEFRFTDVTAQAGIEFERTSGATGERLLPETMGSGAAFFDYDADGDPDLLLIDSRSWDEPAAGDPSSLALYANQSTPSAVRFVEVSAEAGLEASFYGMGCAVGDVEGDGDLDLYVTALGANHLFLNQGDGSFRELPGAGGAAGADDAWSTSAGFFDADLDGDLDLFCCNYVRWSAEIDAELAYTLDGETRAYGPPANYAGVHMSYFENLGDGRFSDRSAEAGIEVSNPATGTPVGKGLGVSFADIDGDGDSDVFVANDTVQNFLFVNQGDGTFEELGQTSGVAFDRNGRATGAMGIDVADYRNDGVWGFAIGNFANEMSSLYAVQHRPELILSLADEAIVEGVGAPSRRALSFGMLFADFDLDGRLDLVQTNGHLEGEINRFQPSQNYRQAAQLFWNAGSQARSAFREVPPDKLGDLARPIVGRGSAAADIDGDGDVDLVMTQAEGPPLLLRNDTPTGHAWLRVVLSDGRAEPETVIGALVELETQEGIQRRLVGPTKSYLSQSELALTFGLGTQSAPARLHVTWPDGTTEERSVDTFGETLRIERVQ